MSESTEPAIDDETYAGLEEIADGDTDFMVDLLEQYLVDAESLIACLVEAAENADAENVERTAHTLKSASGNVGALLLFDMCEDLQNRANAVQIDGVEERAREAEAEFERVREELQNRLAKLTD